MTLDVLLYYMSLILMSIIPLMGNKIYKFLTEAIIK